MVIRNLTAMWIMDQNFVWSQDDFWAGLLVFLECFIGFFMLIAVINGSNKIPALKSPFGALMINQNCAQLVACVNSGTFYIFGVLLDLKFVLRNSNYFGNLSIYLLPVILGSFFLMSLNRFCACTMPFTYKAIFSKKWISYLLFINWSISLLGWFYSVWIRECNFVFYHYGWIFTSAPYTEICRGFVASYAMKVQLTLSFLILLLDLATLSVLLFYRRKFYQAHSAENRRKEISFALQVLIQGIVFLMHGFWYDFGYSWIPGDDERWKNFFTTSFSANLMHIFDPLIVFLFNAEFRKWLFRSCQSTISKNRNVTVVSNVGSRTSR